MKLIILSICLFMLSGCDDNKDKLMCRLSDGRAIQLIEHTGDTYFIRDVNETEYEFIRKQKD